MAERRLLAVTTALLVVAGLGVWLLPLARLRALLARLAGSTRPQPLPTPAVERVVAAVAAGSRWVFVARCLSQALTAEAVLNSAGYPVRLRLGVARTDRGRLTAHAWLEHEGKIVLGGEDSPARYQTIPVSLIGSG